MAARTFGRPADRPTASSPSKPGVLKHGNSRIPARFYVHIAAAGTAALMAVLAVRGMTTTQQIAPCSERFDEGALFGLQDKTGAPVSTVDLQGRLAGRDWGLLKNLRVVPVKDGPAEVAMQISLPKLPPPTNGDAPQAESGMGFTWLLPKLAGVRAACLTYNVYLPKSFNFTGGGMLPGIFGGETSDSPSQAAGGAFSVRNTWDGMGIARARAVTPDTPAGIGFALGREPMDLPLDQWVRIEQELVLNEPGASNGALRIWINGKLRHEAENIIFRTSSGSQLRGVVADVHYGVAQPAGTTSAPQSTAIKVTPFELRWR